MKKILIIGFILIGFVNSISFASDSLKVKGKDHFQIGIRYFKVSNDFVNHSNNGMGIYGSYNFSIIKKIGIDGVVELGFDRLSGNEFIPKSEWYQSPVWLGAGIQKRLTLFSENDFVIGINLKGFGISKPDSWLYNPETEERQYTYIDKVTILYGVKVGYKFNSTIPISLNLGVDFDHNYTMTSIGLSYAF